MKVLVVDDDNGIRMLVRAALTGRDEDCEVRTASTAHEALEACDDFRPHVAVLDYWMPGVRGDRLARALRARYPDIAVLALTGVFNETPPWADALFRKCDLHDPDRLVALVQDVASVRV